MSQGKDGFIEVGGGGAETQCAEGEGYEIEGEVVIAYRVVVVKKVGWVGREKRVELGGV